MMTFISYKLSSYPPTLNPPQAVASNSLSRNITSVCMDEPVTGSWIPPAADAGGGSLREDPSTSVASAPPHPRGELWTLDNNGFFANLVLPQAPSHTPFQNLDAATAFNTTVLQARMCPYRPPHAAQSKAAGNDASVGLRLYGLQLADTLASWLRSPCLIPSHSLPGIVPSGGSGGTGSWPVPAGASTGLGLEMAAAPPVLLLGDPVGRLSRLSPVPASAARVLVALQTAILKCCPAARPLLSAGGPENGPESSASQHAAFRGTFVRLGHLHRRPPPGVDLCSPPRGRGAVQGHRWRFDRGLPGPHQRPAA